MADAPRQTEWSPHSPIPCECCRRLSGGRDRAIEAPPLLKKILPVPPGWINPSLQKRRLEVASDTLVELLARIGTSSGWRVARSSYHILLCRLPLQRTAANSILS